MSSPEAPPRSRPWRERDLRSDDGAADRDVLVAELNVLRSRVRGEDVRQHEAELRAVAAVAARSRLDQLVEAFRLSAFERSVLLLAGGPELVGAVATELQQRTGIPVLTFGTALALLPGGHWSALAPGAPLRRWELVTLEDPRTPANSPLLVDERVLNHLVGVDGLDDRIEHLARRSPPVAALPAAWEGTTYELAVAWTAGTVAVRGRQDSCRAVVSRAAQSLGMALFEVSGADLPSDAAELARALRLLERESRIDGHAWLLDLDGVDPTIATRIARSCSECTGHFALTVGDHALPPGSGWTSVVVPPLDISGRAELLTRALLREGAPTDGVTAAAGVFDLTVDQVTAVAADVSGGQPLWISCRRRSRVASSLARTMTARASWDDLVLPPGQLAQLHMLVAAVRHRSVVLDDWGFADRTRRGLGTTALFTGASGTGKTLAAEVVAHDLKLDLLHVDLSQAVSKYIGDTEKNLRQVFDAAEQGSAVLLFDEADTLFGKRSEVKDSHDRYANLEVGYLLQRMEEFRGLAILTTNARGALDQAFLRRLHAVVSFPYPDGVARARLWRSAFPPGAPTSTLDVDAIAQVDVPGGTIAAAALTAAYLAAARGSEVTTDLVREALGWELAKTGRTVAGR